jgi:FAD:protein FMN transferase
MTRNSARTRNRNRRRVAAVSVASFLALLAYEAARPSRRRSGSVACQDEVVDELDTPIEERPADDDHAAGLDDHRPRSLRRRRSGLLDRRLLHPAREQHTQHRLVVSALDRSFRAMGCTIRVIIDPGRAGPPLERNFAWTRAFLAGFDRRLSRFRADSELSALNRDPAERVPVSPLLRALIRAAIWAARRSGGLVDPTLVGELHASGYARSWPSPGSAGRGSLGGPASPARRPAIRSGMARHRPGRRRRRLASARDPAGLRRHRQRARRGHRGAAPGKVSAGTVRLRWRHRRGRNRIDDFPFEIDVRDRFERDSPCRVALADGAIATSGIDRRIWRRGDGTVAHHLLDPSTGAPAWTGLVAATAQGGTAVEAEALAKAAFLAGPKRAPRVLGGAAGLLFHDSGRVEVVT